MGVGLTEVIVYYDGKVIAGVVSGPHGAVYNVGVTDGEVRG